MNQRRGAEDRHGSQRTLLIRFEVLNGTPELKSYFREQVAVVNAGGFWNCLAAAETLRRFSKARGDPRGSDAFGRRKRAGTMCFIDLWSWCAHPKDWPGLPHYVCVDRGIVYDPAACRPIQLRRYSRRVFGEDLRSRCLSRRNSSRSISLAGQLASRGRLRAEFVKRQPTAALRIPTSGSRKSANSLVR